MGTANTNTYYQPTNQLTFAIYLYRSSDLSAIIMYQMSILVRLIQMYFDSFALTVAHYTWALAFTVTAVAVPQQQFIRQSFTFHLLDCNKTSLYCVRWSQSPQSTHDSCYLCISKDSFIGSTKRLCLFDTFQRAHFALQINLCDFVLLFLCAVSQFAQIIRLLDSIVHVIKFIDTTHQYQQQRQQSQPSNRHEQKDNKRKKRLRSRHKMIKTCENKRDYKNIKR